jgi:hypothetical protein
MKLSQRQEENKTFVKAQSYNFMSLERAITCVPHSCSCCLIASPIAFPNKLLPFLQHLSQINESRRYLFSFSARIRHPKEHNRRRSKKLFIVSTVWSANKLIKWFSK